MAKRKNEVKCEIKMYSSMMMLEMAKMVIMIMVLVVILRANGLSFISCDFSFCLNGVKLRGVLGG